MKRVLCLACLLVFAPAAHSQSGPFAFPFPNPFPWLPVRISIPRVESETSSFAYLQENASGQTLRLARMVNAFLLPTAEPIATLANENGETEEILDLLASPDNRWLAVYTFQDTGEGFIDNNLSFFDMRTGLGLGLRNEHAFSALELAVAPSQRLAEFQAAEAEIGVPPEQLALLDYRVVTEGANISLPEYQWNADGTFGLSFELDVEAYYPESEPQFIGVERFTLIVEPSEATLATIGFGPERPAASFPNVFTLTPVGEPAETIRFEGQPIRIRAWFYNQYLELVFPYYYYPTATMIEGNIPRQHSLL